MRDLTKGKETATIIAFALPMLLGNLFQQFYNMVDSIVVGQFVGKDALAAVGVSFPILFMMIALVMGVTMGSTILIAQFFGAGDLKKVRAVVDTAYVSLFFAALALTVIGLLAADAILDALDVPPGIHAAAAVYLRILFAGFLPMFGYNTVSAILRGLGDSKTPLYILMAATLLNIVLDLLFVVAFGWGVAGVAWATVIAQGMSFAGGIILIDRRNELVRLRVRELKFDRDMFALSLKLGLPSGIQQTLVGLGMTVLSRVVNAFGTDTIAAFAAAARLDNLASLPAMNLSQALSTFVGQNMGAGKTERVKRGHLSAVIVGVGISIVIGLAVVFFGKPMMAIFSSDASVIAIGARYLFIVGLGYWLFALMFINNGVVRGAGDVMIPMINTLLALWVVRLPLAFWLSGFMGSDGIWLSVPAGWVVGAVFSTWYYLGGRWKTKMIARKAPPSEAAAD
ncbi:MAG: MATE family efflux transporter [Spirochaetes bacterium]|nr:MATE family efflux transporter [Spirochaetota bacterium]